MTFFIVFYFSISYSYMISEDKNKHKLFRRAVFFPDIFDASIFHFAFEARRPMQVAFANNAQILLENVFC